MIFNNILFNSYFDRIKRKVNQKPTLYEYSLFVIYLIIFLKLMICLNLNYETRIMLFDVPLMLGGIAKYNTFFLSGATVMGAVITKYIHLNTSLDMMKWTEIFESIRGCVDPEYIGFNGKHNKYYQKLCKFAENIYKFQTYFYCIISKFFSIVFFKLKFL